jgi:heat shock protein HslJ
MPVLSYAVIALAILAMLWPASPPSAQAGLAGSQWKVVEIDGMRVSGTVRFTHSTIRGRVPCSAYSGAFREREGGITIVGLTVTRMRCAGSAADDRALIERLGQARTYRVDGDSLLLIDRDGRAVARLAG